MGSEHESEAGRTPARDANRTPKDGSGPTDADAGRKPQEVNTTSRTDFEREQERKEGRQPIRTPEEMSLHDEFDRLSKEKRH